MQHMIRILLLAVLSIMPVVAKAHPGAHGETTSLTHRVHHLLFDGSVFALILLLAVGFIFRSRVRSTVRAWLGLGQV